MVCFHDGLNARSLHAFCKGCTTLPCCRKNVMYPSISSYSKFCNRPPSVLKELSIGIDTSYRYLHRTILKKHQNMISISFWDIHIFVNLSTKTLTARDSKTHGLPGLSHLPAPFFSRWMARCRGWGARAPCKRRRRPWGATTGGTDTRKRGCLAVIFTQYI